MPRYAPNDRYQVGDFWLGQRSGSPAWYRMWNDTKTHRTGRASLGTTDFEKAKAILNDWFVLNQAKTQEDPDETTLAEVFARFYEHHGQHLRSAVDVRRTLRYWLEFHGEATIKQGLHQDQQLKFRTWLAEEKGLSQSSVRNALMIGKSALNWAWKRGDIAFVPYVQLVSAPKPEPKGRPLEVKEVAKLLSAADDQHIRVLIAFMIATAARTGAILDLTLPQIDLEHRLIDLNPRGREQTKKYRPVVKLPEQLVPYIEARKHASDLESLVIYDGSAIDSVKRSWATTRIAAALEGNVQTYSFRHTVARWLRKQSVPAWEVAAQLGHKAPDYSTTEIYAPFDPAYLTKATAAIDLFLCQVARQLRASSMSEFLLNEA